MASRGQGPTFRPGQADASDDAGKSKRSLGAPMPVGLQTSGDPAGLRWGPGSGLSFATSDPGARRQRLASDVQWPISQVSTSESIGFVRR